MEVLGSRMLKRIHGCTYIHAHVQTHTGDIESSFVGQ